MRARTHTHTPCHAKHRRDSTTCVIAHVGGRALGVREGGCTHAPSRPAKAAICHATKKTTAPPKLRAEKQKAPAHPQNKHAWGRHPASLSLSLTALYSSCGGSRSVLVLSLSPALSAFLHVPRNANSHATEDESIPLRPNPHHGTQPAHAQRRTTTRVRQ